MVLNQIRAEGEVDDRARLDAVRVEIRSRILRDERRRKRVVRIGKERGDVGTGHQSRVVADVRGHPDSGGAEVEAQRALRLQLLIVVDQEGAAGERVDRAGVEEESAGERRYVLGVRVSEGKESSEAGSLGQIEAHVPSIEVAPS